jgi:hypothetical protein
MEFRKQARYKTVKCYSGYKKEMDADIPPLTKRKIRTLTDSV